MSDITTRGYAHPEVLVSTDWVQQHLDDPKVRLIESNEDTLLYSSGHVPGAVHVDWTSDLNDQIRRDYITREGFERLMSRIGAAPDTTIVFYGDKNNWWATYAFWVFQRQTELDKVVYVNNYLLSTNLYPSVNEEQLKTLTDILPKWFPDRVIVFRSVDQKKNLHVYEELEKNHYEMVLSRQVWYMDPVEASHTRQYKEDMRVLRKHGYEIVDGKELSDDELAQSLDLYNMLYLQKYSYYNPQFTLEFMKLARDEEILHLRALKRDGKINAVMGFFIRNGAMTQPLFGYDTSLPQEEGLYRLLTLITLQEGIKRGLLVHASGGVGKFKKVRGGKSVIEYNAVYYQHLPAKRRRPWQLIKMISKYAIPYFQKMDF